MCYTYDDLSRVAQRKTVNAVTGEEKTENFQSRTRRKLMKKSDKKLLIGTASVVLLIIVGVIACLIFKISYVLETPAPGYVYLYGYSAMKIDYGASTSVTKSSTVISLEGLQIGRAHV